MLIDYIHGAACIKTTDEHIHPFMGSSVPVTGVLTWNQGIRCSSWTSGGEYHRKCCYCSCLFSCTSKLARVFGIIVFVLIASVALPSQTKAFQPPAAGHVVPLALRHTCAAEDTRVFTPQSSYVFRALNDTDPIMRDAAAHLAAIGQTDDQPDTGFGTLLKMTSATPHTTSSAIKNTSIQQISSPWWWITELLY